MSSYNQKVIDDLISVRKKIIEPPKKAMQSVNGSLRNDMRVASDDGNEYAVFMRICETFEEDFSVGLRHIPTTESGIILLRCNGPHGEVRNGLNGHPHFGFHVHRAQEQSILDGKRPESGAIITKEFASFKQALRYFLRITNIQWSETDFPGLAQKELFS